MEDVFGGRLQAGRVARAGGEALGHAGVETTRLRLRGPDDLGPTLRRNSWRLSIGAEEASSIRNVDGTR